MALTGSLWRAPLLVRATREALSEDYILLPVSVPQVVGALTAAAEPAGFDPDDAFRQRLGDLLAARG